MRMPLIISKKNINMYILCLMKEGNGGGYMTCAKKPKFTKCSKNDDISKKIISI
jgi:hypothetical protein